VTSSRSISLRSPQWAILETGVHNKTALSLFTSAGYQPVDSYVEGRDPDIKRAFARSLTDGLVSIRVPG
jgi:hypothetical protein